MSPRSWLFVPADRPDRMEKAVGGGADAVILDLEDSVAEDRKPAARQEAAAFLQAHQRGARAAAVWVRINPLATPHALSDLQAVVAGAPDGVVLPKPDSAADAVRLGHHLSELEATHGLDAGSTSVLPIATETPASVFAMGGYAAARERLAGLTWGAEDLSAAVGAAAYRDAGGGLTPLYQLARSLCLAGAAAAGTPAVETVYPDFRDLDGLAAFVAAARRDGFTGMLAIHPAQVPVINAGFTPSAAEVERARRIVALFAAQPTAGVVGLDGRMLDRPHLEQARRILARAGTT